MMLGTTNIEYHLGVEIDSALSYLRWCIYRSIYAYLAVTTNIVATQQSSGLSRHINFVLLARRTTLL